jgi:hypothetical protein
MVGASVGDSLGQSEGAGLSVGSTDGTLVGAAVGFGAIVGEREGRPVGLPDGLLEGIEEGFDDGDNDGAKDGTSDGALFGCDDGCDDGVVDGVSDGLQLGEGEGCTVGAVVVEAAHTAAFGDFFRRLDSTHNQVMMKTTNTITIAPTINHFLLRFGDELGTASADPSSETDSETVGLSSSEAESECFEKDSVFVVDSLSSGLGIVKAKVELG